VVPEWFGAVSRFYERFGQTTDEEVVRLLPGALGG
jgi:predicted phosphoribosyltransferase